MNVEKRMKISCLMLIGCILLFSCSNYRGKRKALDERDISGKTIILSPDLIPKYNGRDTVLLIEDVPKIIVYYDSIECSSCLLNQMFEWSDMITYCETLPRPVPVYFILNPRKSDIYTLLKILKIQAFDYPVWIDTAGIFKKLNHLVLKDNSRDCFLLNSKNEITVTGVPNKSIEKMRQYQEKIFELLANNE